jgi:hypothetical protein
MVLGLVAASVATAEAKGKKKPSRAERTVETRYECEPAVFPPVCSGQYREYVETRATEAFFTAKVSDAHGQPLYVNVYEDYPGKHRLVGSFCGETSEPMSFHPGAVLTFSIDIYISVAPVSCPAGRLATNGTTTVTLSNLP